MADETTPQGAQETPQGEETEQPTQKVKWETWLGDQAAEVKAAYEEHVNGLKSALASERSERKSLADQLRKLSKSAEAGSELQTRLDETVGALEEAEAKAQFFEDAAPVVANLRVAWVYAKSAGLVDKHGRVDMARLRVEAPQLFETPRKAAPPAHAGNSAKDAPPPQRNMNDFIRQSAGRR